MLNKSVFVSILTKKDEHFKALGCGTFINSKGKFITAGHVLFKHAKEGNCYAWNSELMKEPLLIKFLECRHEIDESKKRPQYYDIGIGEVAVEGNDFLEPIKYQPSRKELIRVAGIVPTNSLSKLEFIDLELLDSAYFNNSYKVEYDIIRKENKNYVGGCTFLKREGVELNKGKSGAAILKSNDQLVGVLIGGHNEVGKKIEEPHGFNAIYNMVCF